MTWRSSTTSAGISAAAIAALFVLLPSNQAQARSRFDLPVSNVTLTTSYRGLVGGRLGSESGSGMGIRFAQSLQYKWIGFTTGVGSSFFLTNQDPPPFERGVQFYEYYLGPRVIVPFRDFRFWGDVEYQRVGVVSNALVRVTGPSLSYNAVGGQGTIVWQPSSMIFGVGGAYSHFLDINGGGWSAHFTIGVEGSL